MINPNMIDPKILIGKLMFIERPGSIHGGTLILVLSKWENAKPYFLVKLMTLAVSSFYKKHDSASEFRTRQLKIFVYSTRQSRQTSFTCLSSCGILQEDF